MLIIGLGNPGEEYARTRHNVGWMVVDALVAKHRGTWAKPSRLYLEANIRIHGKTTFVVKPLTYMNASGVAAKQALTSHALKISELLVVVDEYNFDVGKINLRKQGSAGGHNGMASMMQELQTEQFMRLRLGISRDFGPGELVDYVLSEFPDSQNEAVETMISNAVGTIEELISNRR